MATYLLKISINTAIPKVIAAFLYACSGNIIYPNEVNINPSNTFIPVTALSIYPFNPIVVSPKQSLI